MTTQFSSLRVYKPDSQMYLVDGDIITHQDGRQLVFRGCNATGQTIMVTETPKQDLTEAAFIPPGLFAMEVREP